MFLFHGNGVALACRADAARLSSFRNEVRGQVRGRFGRGACRRSFDGLRMKVVRLGSFDGLRMKVVRAQDDNWWTRDGEGSAPPAPRGTLPSNGLEGREEAGPSVPPEKLTGHELGAYTRKVKEKS